MHTHTHSHSCQWSRYCTQRVSAHPIAMQMVVCWAACACVWLAVVSGAVAAAASPHEQAVALVKQLSLPEKVSLLSGVEGPYTGNVPGNARVGIPPLHYADSPQGVGDGFHGVTCWPSALTVAASWNKTSFAQFGAAMGREQRVKGSNIMLGPGLCLIRVPTNGRAMEYISEDPYLTAVAGFGVVKGVQSEGVVATAKHYIDNGVEGPGHNGRLLSNSIIDEKTQRDVYDMAFRAAVEAGAGAFMCSYNLINGTYACQNKGSLGYLKSPAGLNHQGWVMSDWGATHSLVPSVDAGLDQEMSSTHYFGANLTKAVMENEIPESRVDEMAVLLITQLITVGVMGGGFDYGNTSSPATSPQHEALAQTLAEESLVLLKNEGQLLPLDPSSLHTVGVVGDANTVHGLGSGWVNAPFIISPTDGIRSRLQHTDVRLLNHSTYSHGCAFPTQCLNLTANLTEGDIRAAVDIAAQSDVMIVNLAMATGEGYDRTDLSLGRMQNKLVDAVLAAQPRTIVVVRNPGAVTMPWLDAAPAVLAQFLPGQACGNALAAVLFGDVDPSGRLPISFPTSMADTWLRSPEQYPGVLNPSTGHYDVSYAEKEAFGYRWYLQQGVSPLFPFGFGLSYTTFSYAELRIEHSQSHDEVLIAVTLTNTGTRTGKDVVQLYVGFPEAAGKPSRVLRGFEKVELATQQSGSVHFSLVSGALEAWDTATSSYAVYPGQYGVFVGASAEDIRLTGTFILN